MPKKSLVVGLGGTGDWVLTILKSRLKWAYGEEDVGRDVRFLLVDTIHDKTREDALGTDRKKFSVKTALDEHEEEVAHMGDVRIEPHEYLGVTGDIHPLAESIRGGQDAHTRHLGWFRADYYLRALPRAAMNITLGAGQWRQFGRLALTLSAERDVFTRRVARLLDELKVPQGDGAMVYVVCSLSGGTGAGMFLDAAALIRHVANQLDRPIWIVGFLLLPSAFAKVWSSQAVMETGIPRSYAAFRELERMQTEAGHEVPFPIRYSLNLECLVNTKLYDTVFLFDAVTEWKDLSNVPPWKGISPSVADGIEVLTDRARGAQLLQDLVNAAAKAADDVRMNQTLPAQFHSLGSHKIVLPARQYGTIFASRFVRDLLQNVFPVGPGSRAQAPTLQRDPADYAELALNFMVTVPNLFPRIVDYLPGRPQAGRLEGFARGTLDDYRPLLRPRKVPEGLELNFLTVEPLEGLETGKETGETAEDATNRLKRECVQKLDAYWARLTSFWTALDAQVEEEISTELGNKVEEILNRRVPELRTMPVGSAHYFLHTIEQQCVELQAQVLATTKDRINRQNGGNNSLGHWETRTTYAVTAMEATKGCDGFFTRGRAHTAQRQYLAELAAYVERRKLDEVMQAFDRIVEIFRNCARRIAGRIEQWADIAVLSEQYGACTKAGEEIARIEQVLRQSGESFTSSYGLNAYQPDQMVDITMGGYQEDLYQRLVRPRLTRWLERVEWRCLKDNLDVTFLLSVDGSTRRVTPRHNSGVELLQSIFDEAKGDIYADVTNLSIFDYFLDKGLSPEQLAQFLKENCGPLIGRPRVVAGTAQTRDIHLLVQSPRRPEGERFLASLRPLLQTGFDGATFQEGQSVDYDNPYTLCLLYLVQNLQVRNIPILQEYERKYNEQLTRSDTHLVNHVFRAEQEATIIEKAYNRQMGTVQDWRRLTPRVCRLLDQPERLKAFVQLWALDIIRLVPNPEDQLEEVWMAVVDGDPSSRRVPWLTGGLGNANASVLLAMERFCFHGRSARPGGGIPIDYEALDRALKAARNTIVAVPGGRDALHERYASFAEHGLSDAVERCKPPMHSDAEAEDIVIVVRHYLEDALGRPLTRDH